MRAWHCGCRGALAAALALVPLLAPAQVAAPAAPQATPACAGADAADNIAPFYPVAELWRMSSHTVTVLIDADACGRPTGAALERSARVEAMDAAAMDAARRWVIPVAWRGRPRYRVPFDFSPLPAELEHPTLPRAADPFAEERRSGRVDLAEVTAYDPAEGLPGYLPDPWPIGYADLVEAVQELSRLGVVRRYPDALYIWVRDAEGVSLFQWFGPLLVRNRRVEQDGLQFVVSSALCGNDLAACRQQLGRLQAGRGRQYPDRAASAR